MKTALIALALVAAALLTGAIAAGLFLHSEPFNALLQLLVGRP